MASFLIVENASLATTYPDDCTAYMMYMTVPVTVSMEESFFSKLKLIKNFLRSSMSQERLSGLALLSIENERDKKNLDFRKVIQPQVNCGNVSIQYCTLILFGLNNLSGFHSTFLFC